MKTITAIRNRIEKHLSDKLQTLDEDVDRMASDFISENVNTIIATAFGFEKRWSDSGYEVHRYFEESPVGKRLQKMAAKAAEAMFPAIEKEANKQVSKKTKWLKVYRESYIESFNDRMHELVQASSDERGRHDAEREWEALLNSEMQDPGVFDRGRERQLRGDDDEG